ncbi:MAG: DUF1802 family protein [Pirellulales bacterium]
MLQVALKEWAVICDRLLSGDQAILLRKGGIEEVDGPGRFRLKASRFALFPAWLHQRPDRIKPQWRDQVDVRTAEPAEITIHGFGEVAHIWQVPSRESIDALDDLHSWTADQLDMRWNYKPHQPLYLLAVRAYRLAHPKMITNNPTYAGCKSWVELETVDAIDDHDAVTAIGDATFSEIVARIESTLS